MDTLASMKGKTCLVTGATRGIGKQTALALAKMGATLVIVGRDPTRGEEVASEIKAQSANDDVTLLVADLSSMQAVRQLAANFTERFSRLHVLVNNAGGINVERRTTLDGYELTLASNHLGHFLLTNLLLDVLEASAPARIVNVSSQAHVGGHIHFDDLHGERRYSGYRAYGQAKLANILFTYELARRLDGTRITANCLHPGVVATNFGHGPGVLGVVVKVLAPFFRTAEKGAQTSIYLASSLEVEGTSGKYFSDCRAAKSSPESRDEAVARRLWLVSERLTGLAPA